MDRGRGYTLQVHAGRAKTFVFSFVEHHTGDAKAPNHEAAAERGGACEANAADWGADVRRARRQRTSVEEET